MALIKIGTRGSDLALWQANFVKNKLENLGCEVEIHIIKTQGDKIQHLSFDKLEGKGFFTKEIEDALIDESIDLAVHSLKDLETNQPDGLEIVAVSDREDPSDILLIKKHAYDPTKQLMLKENAIVGTSSVRRKAILSAFRSDLNITDLRGNVPTRIDKLRDGNYDAIVLANAGVSRLKIDLSEFEVEILKPQDFIPAPAQGVLGLQTRSNDEETKKHVSKINNPAIKSIIDIERGVLNKLNGGCQLPLGVYAEKTNGKYEVWAALGQKDGLLKRVQASFESEQNAADSIVTALKKKIVLKRVFISKNLDKNSLFKSNFILKEFKIIGESLIRFQINYVKNVPETKWVFFTSKNSVRFFFKQNIHLNNRKVACVGRGTHRELTKHVSKIDFVGDSVNINDVGKAFVKEVNDDDCLFPVSNISKRTIQKYFPNQAKTHDLIVYNTIEKNDFQDPKADVLIFTSPSNARAYFSQFKLKEGQSIVSIGPTTEKELKKIGIHNYKVPKSTGELGLIDLI
ncbi:MAG: hydroxymethylbilane synthase [Flavobacteriales bacterium]|nr:hydroxymethylbilane synthase [Flavobacteriales bacterium]